MCAAGQGQWMGSKTGYTQCVQQDGDSGWKQNRIHAMCATGQGQWMGSKTGYTQCVQQDGDSGWEAMCAAGQALTASYSGTVQDAGQLR